MNNAPNNGQMLCIICMKMKPCRTTGGEHVIPYALGGSLTIDRVCEECDNRSGHGIDAELVAHYQVEQTRADLELRGQSGKVPDPQGRAASGVFIGSENPNLRVNFERDAASGELKPKILSYVKFKLTKTTDPEGTLVEKEDVFIDPSDAGKAEDLAKEALRRAGMTDEAAIDTIARGFAESLEESVEPQVVSRKVKVRTGGHQQGLLKVAYELAWYWLGDEWLNDPLAVAMRASLNGSETQGIRGKIYDDPDVAVIARGGDQRVVHIMYVYEFGGNLLLFVRLFNIFTAGFVVSANATTYTIPKNNAIVMQVEQRQYEETTFGALEPGSVVWEHRPDSPIK